MIRTGRTTAKLKAAMLPGLIIAISFAGLVDTISKEQLIRGDNLAVVNFISTLSNISAAMFPNQLYFIMVGYGSDPRTISVVTFFTAVAIAMLVFIGTRKIGLLRSAAVYVCVSILASLLAFVM